MSTLTKEVRDELAIVYAALILHDEKIGITAEKLATLTKAANVDVEPYWPMVFAKFLETKNISEILSNVGGAPAVAPVEQAQQTTEETKEEEKEEKKEEKEESASGEDMGFGLFGDDDD